MTLRSRIHALKQDLLAGHSPKENIVFGLGCNRTLGISAAESEEYSERKLHETQQDTTEMNMVTLLTSECLNELSRQDSHFEVALTPAELEEASLLFQGEFKEDTVLQRISSLKS